MKRSQKDIIHLKPYGHERPTKQSPLISRPESPTKAKPFPGPPRLVASLWRVARYNDSQYGADKRLVRPVGRRISRNTAHTARNTAHILPIKPLVNLTTDLYTARAGPRLISPCDGHGDAHQSNSPRRADRPPAPAVLKTVNVVGDILPASISHKIARRLHYLPQK